MNWCAQDEKGGRFLTALLFCVGLVQVAIYYLAGALVNGADGMAIAQPDTLLYLQAARRVAEGHAFSFCVGEPACTGTTSVLHPFLFSVFWLLGVGERCQVSIGFWANAVLYLVFLQGWGVAVRRWIDDGFAQVFAALLLALFGQTAYAAMAQSDIGLWLAVSGWLAAGLAMRKIWIWGPLLILGPWIRPEGMVCVISAAAVGIVLSVAGVVRVRKSEFAVVSLAIVSMLGVFALNFALTGHAQFSSVANKGYFATLTFGQAVDSTVLDAIEILKALTLGMAPQTPRVYYMIPLLGGGLFWLGVVAHPWRRESIRGELVIVVAALGGILTVASSGWQNTNTDRYLAWVMPLPVVFMACGVAELRRRVPRKSLAVALTALPVLYSVGGTIALAVGFNAAAARSDLLLAFGRHLDKKLPVDASVGVTGYSGIAYALPGRHVVTLSGIYSPAFVGKDYDSGFEQLKTEPSLRFDYWFIAGDDKFCAGFLDIHGEQVCVGPEGYEVRRADWEVFDWSAVPHADGLDALSLRHRVDVGNDLDERNSGYEITTRYGELPPSKFTCVSQLAGRRCVEASRVVTGDDAMYAPLEPGKDCTVVIRTLSTARVTQPVYVGGSGKITFAVRSPMTLQVSVDGVEVGAFDLPVSETGFSDVKLTIPGRFITSPVSRIAFMGDHIACCYWFFQ